MSSKYVRWFAVSDCVLFRMVLSVFKKVLHIWIVVLKGISVFEGSGWFANYCNLGSTEAIVSGTEVCCSLKNWEKKTPFRRSLLWERFDSCKEPAELFNWSHLGSPSQCHWKEICSMYRFSTHLHAAGVYTSLICKLTLGLLICAVKLCVFLQCKHASDIA